MSERGSMPLIVAHRGSSGVAPENTLAAFRQAIDDGADMIELDVRMTKDFELVVLHDRTMRRTTSGHGSIWNHTLADLQHVDAGSWFNKKFAGERIPTLRKVMDILPRRLHLNIEVKTDRERRKRIALEESLLLLIRERDFSSRVLVSSFDHTFLHRFHTLDPEISIGVLYSPVRHIARKPLTLVRKVGATTFVCSIARLQKHLSETMRENHITLACYGVNTRKQFEKAAKYGVGMIITDYPEKIGRFLTGKRA